MVLCYGSPRSEYREFGQTAYNHTAGDDRGHTEHKPCDSHRRVPPIVLGFTPKLYVCVLSYIFCFFFFQISIIISLNRLYLSPHSPFLKKKHSNPTGKSKEKYNEHTYSLHLDPPITILPCLFLSYFCLKSFESCRSSDISH